MKQIHKLLCIILGNTILAAGVAAFIEPTGIISGGTTGVGLVFQYYFDIPISVTFAGVNIICFFLGLCALGKSFAVSSALSTAIFPVILAAFEKVPFISTMADDLFLCSVMSGIFSGLGVGLVMRESASTGGLDIPPIILSKRLGVSVGNVMMGMNVMILLLQVFFSNPRQVVYGVIYTILTSLSLDRVLRSGQQGAQMLIISDQFEEIRQRLLTESVGVTMLPSEGGYERKTRQAVLCAVPSRRLPEVKRLVEEIDSGAFVLVNSVAEIMGKGFTLPR